MSTNAEDFGCRCGTNDSARPGQEKLGLGAFKPVCGQLAMDLTTYGPPSGLASVAVDRSLSRKFAELVDLVENDPPRRSMVDHHG